MNQNKRKLLEESIEFDLAQAEGLIDNDWPDERWAAIRRSIISRLFMASVGISALKKV